MFNWRINCTLLYYHIRITSRRGDCSTIFTMKKLFLIFLLLMIPLASAVTYFPESAMKVYDNFNDGSFNTSAWKTNGGFDLVLEANGILNVSIVDPAGAESGQLLSNNLTSLTQIFNLTFETMAIHTCTGAETSHWNVDVFGTQLDTIAEIGSCSARTHSNNWTVTKNLTQPADFIIYKDGVFNKTITASNNFINADMVYTGAETSSYQNVWYNVSYNNVDMINITLVLPTNASFTAQTPTNFTANISNNAVNNLKNVTFYLWNSTNDVVNSSLRTITGNSTTFNHSFPIATFDDYHWNIYVCNVGDNCAFADSNSTFTWGTQLLSEVFALNITETQSTTISANVTIGGATITAARLEWNGTQRTGTVSSISGDDYLLSSTFTVPIGTGRKDFFWNITLSTGHNRTFATSNQTVSLLNVSLCGAPYTIPFINLTYKNETVAEESTTAFVSSSTWNYYIGDGTVNKTFTYSNAAEAASHAFCYTPPHETIKNQILYSFDNSESQQRVYEPSLLSLTNTTKNQILWLLPTSDGIFVTFQVINAGEQPLSGVLVSIARTGFGTISTTTTGADGATTIWLNPNFEYTATFSKSGFPDFTVTQSFPQNDYTINMGSSAILGNDYTKGVTTTVNPQLGTVLSNNTSHNFNVTLASSFWTIDSWGFVLFNETGGSIASTSSASVGFLGTDYDVGNNTAMSMNVFWIVDGNYTNQTYFWSVDEGSRAGSIAKFFDRLSTFTGDGVYGLTAFNLSLLVFFGIFITVGIMNVKFGLSGGTSQIVMGIAALFMFLLFNQIGILDIKSAMTISVIYVFGAVLLYGGNR